jgi:Protein of unknown function (DUF4058)
MMPSPFPGMDPYLENQDWFPCLHDCLIVGLLETLQSRLPEPYYAQTTQRVWLEVSRRSVEPDVDVIHPGWSHSRREENVGGVAVAVEVDQDEPIAVAVETIEDDPFVEPVIEIRRRQGADVRLVASIEVLSPANKTPDNPSRVKYLDKQREVLAGPTHLIEIDLLRGGDHTTAVPLELAVAKTGVFDYHVCVHRFDQPDLYFVYPIKLEQRLPGIRIPLLPGDPDVRLPLQPIFDKAYDAGPYRRSILYGEDPIIPTLAPDRLEWVKARLKPPV